MARLDKDGIAIYTAPDMVKLDKKNLKLERAQDVSFSPSEPLMSVYLAGEKEQPGKLLMYQLPEKKEIRSRSYMGAQDLKMFWHPQGDFLALKIEKWVARAVWGCAGLREVCVI
jgi:translation initiation factor 3 subunit B